MLAATLISGCSVNLTKYDLQDFPRTVPFFEPVTLEYNGKTQFLDTNLQRAYTAVIDTASYPMESCRGVARITAKVAPNNEEPSSWNIGTAFVPFWPAQPVSENWHYRLEARIYCSGSLVFKGIFDESEHVEGFWYGRMRADLVNDASQEMHRKLLERLRFETRLQRSADFNAAQDF